MLNLISQILKDRKLTQAERDTLQRYTDDDRSRIFLQVYEILKDYRYADEAVEILTIGLQNHPSFTLARVTLAKELYERKIYSEALRVLLENNDTFQNNYQAHYLCVNLAIILDREDVLKKHLVFIRQENSPQVKKLVDLYDAQGIDAARRFLGVEKNAASYSPEKMEQKDSLRRRSANISDFTAVDYSDSQFDHLLNFHITELEEVFHGEKSSSHQSSGAPLESTTLADIYAKQQHYAKALEIYRHLLIRNPRNENFRQKVIELQQQLKDKMDHDLVVDPQTFQKIEAMEIIQRQINFVEKILAKI